MFRKFREAETAYHELNYLFWECTTRCNLNCIHCGSDCSKNSASPDMPLEDFLAALDTIPEPDHDFLVVFTGGEPLLRDDIEKAGIEIRKRGMQWSMVTNGQLYDENRHRSITGAGIGALTISLDGLEKSHNRMRRSGRSFEKVSEAIRLAATAKKVNFDVVTCVNKMNLPELSEIKEFLIGNGVKQWRLFTIIPIGRATDNPELFLSDEEFVSLMEFIKVSRKDKRMDVTFSCEGYVGKYEGEVRSSYFFCRAGINIASVLVDGSICACPNIDRAFTQGNIYRDNLYEVWQNRFTPFRDRRWTGKGSCATCKDYKDCLGNGFHNWHGAKDEVLVCHNAKIERASKR